MCEQIFDLIVDQKALEEDQSKRKLLNAPVHLGHIFDLQDGMQTDNGIWSAQKETSTVNKKKLIKAEAKLKQKQEKRDHDRVSAPVTVENWKKEATTSQMISKTALKADETGKSKDIKIEQFDIAFGDKVDYLIFDRFRCWFLI